VLLLEALVPVVVSLLGIALVWVTGLTERSFFGTVFEDHFYGFFFRSFPLLLFAMLYGAARIVTAAATEPGPRRGLRAFTTPVGVALFLVASLYPTFGGFVARPGFAAGAVSFQRGQSASVALVLGAGAAAFMFGLFMGLGVIIARLRLSLRWRALGGAVMSFLALWLGAVILLAAQRLDTGLLGNWPMMPLSSTSSLTIAGIVVLTLAPHALTVVLRAHREGS
jgi:hypothetical protein